MRRIAFIVMHAAVHTDDGNIIDIAHDKSAVVAGYRRNRKSGNIFVRDRTYDVINLLRERTETRSKYQSGPGSKIRDGTYVVYTLFYYFVHILSLA